MGLRESDVQLFGKICARNSLSRRTLYNQAGSYFRKYSPSGRYFHVMPSAVSAARAPYGLRPPGNGDGALLDDDGETRVGMALAIDLPDRQSVEQFMQAEPYNNAPAVSFPVPVSSTALTILAQRLL
jgi:hypothetical protein